MLLIFHFDFCSRYEICGCKWRDDDFSSFLVMHGGGGEWLWVMVVDGVTIVQFLIFLHGGSELYDGDGLMAML